MPDESPASPGRFNTERLVQQPPRIQGLTDAQLSAADRVLQRERSRSRVMVRLATTMNAAFGDKLAS